ncbi:MAG: ATP-dependent protease ATPase subunit HslU [Leptospiraceae bacterium]|nr:ATP-dependent protease ATPase subunit HslU [Leptospiraceae bacterium]MCP5500662.1 ATP-dependent protease ATPase subunit HslU [Leptospiraceae bacterium]
MTELLENENKPLAISYELPEPDLTPRQIVEELDQHIVGQKNAKKSVAIAIRNRIRRRKLDSSLREEIYPKNIIMIGPTGVGKTEIARRLSKLYHAPFLKVEATKYTEIGYVGRDVESMIRDLAMVSLNLVKAEFRKRVVEEARKRAEEIIVDILIPDAPVSSPGSFDPENNTLDEERKQRYLETRDLMRKKLQSGKLDEREIEIEIEPQGAGGGMPMFQVFGAGNFEDMDNQLQNMLGDLMNKKSKKRKLPISEAREIIADQEAEKLLDQEKMQREAVRRAEEMGIIFLDEIDKIAGKESRSGADVSREGVQRDLLPIVEGATVSTRIGPVRTDHILFIAAGAFHISKPSDMIPELQGRFPIRVELDKLSMEDFVNILSTPRSSLTKQYEALLATEGVTLEFKDEAIREIARIAFDVNEKTENIGARRLNTILEKLLEDLSFEAPELPEDKKHQVIDAEFVLNRLKGIAEDRDLSKYIL